MRGQCLEFEEVWGYFYEANDAGIKDKGTGEHLRSKRVSLFSVLRAGQTS